MAIDRRIVWLGALGVLAVALLSQLPKLGGADGGRVGSAVGVFAPARVERLSDDNLADAFIMLPLTHRLSRIGWDHDILSVDLAVDPTTADVASIWADASEVVKLAFGKVANVQRLLLRVYAQPSPGAERALLLSGDTRAADWKYLDVSSLRDDGSNGAAAAWTAKLRPVWTPAGERWRRNFAKS